MADEKQILPRSLFAAVKPDLESAPLAVSSDTLVILLHFVGILRALLPVPAIEGSSDVEAAVLDLERRIAALLRAIDELAQEQGPGTR